MKVLFLDVDGVLNCNRRWKGPNAEHLDSFCLLSLADIIEKTEAKIVVSSTWRLYSHIYDSTECSGLLIRLNRYGLDKEVIGYTPDITPRGPRANEIKQWLSEHPEVERFAILDDDADAGFGLEENFFRTNFTHGLTEEIANSVIEFLNKERQKND